MFASFYHFSFLCSTPKKLPQRIPHSGSPPGGAHATDKVELPIQRTDTSVQATRMHCMDHKHSIHNVKVCWSFRWIKQYTHLSVARFWKMCPRGEDFQRKSQKLRYLTDRYMCTSSAHVLYGSQAHHPWCQSVLICPLDQVSDSLVRWKMWNFPTEKSGNYAIQRTDTSALATHLHCMDHKRAIHNVKVCWSFRWIKQYTHLSVAKLLA